MRFTFTAIVALAASTVSGTPLDVFAPLSARSNTNLLPRAAQNDLLAAHNNARGACGVGALKWDNNIAAWAQNYANQRCRNLPTLIHSGRSGYGENLAANTNANLYNMVWKQWVGEIKRYNWRNPGFTEATGHFSQVVWKSTQKVGCGYAACGGSRMTLLVCQYHPAGNVVMRGDPGKYFRDNVKPPRVALKGLVAAAAGAADNVIEDVTNNVPAAEDNGSAPQTEGFPLDTRDVEERSIDEVSSAKMRRHQHHKREERVLTPMR